jgi:hypothetical protein
VLSVFSRLAGMFQKYTIETFYQVKKFFSPLPKSFKISSTVIAGIEAAAALWG